MTPEQITLVRQSWQQIVPLGNALPSLLSQWLTVLNPGLCSQFPGVFSRRPQQLIQIISMAVNNLDRLRPLYPSLQALGYRQAACGVCQADYATLRSALLWSLEQLLEEAFSDPLQDAWSAAYDELCEIIGQATRRDQPVSDAA